MRVLTLAKTDLNQYVAQSQKAHLRKTRFDHYDINTVRNYLSLSHLSKNSLQPSTAMYKYHIISNITLH